MAATQTINASEFKARCLEILDRLADHSLERVTITKRGRIVGVLSPPDNEADAVHQLHGFMRGSVLVPPEIDLTASVSDEAFNADEENLHA